MRKNSNICEGKFLQEVADAIQKGFSEQHFKF